MDDDFDFTFAPSAIVYGPRAIKLDPINEGYCYQGSKNSMCVGVSPQQTQNAPGMIGFSTNPLPLAVPQTDATYPYVPGGSGSLVPVYGPNRRCLIDVDPNFGGQIAPNDLVISSDSGYATKASPFGPWNQWIIGISLSFGSANQTVNIKVVIFPWSPTGS
jgi:hypothetical protein